jgi:hypothetical protein
MSKRRPSALDVPDTVPTPILPCPTSPTQQSESESYRHELFKERRSYPYDKADGIADREMDAEDDD